MFHTYLVWRGMDVVAHVFRGGGDREHKEHTGSKSPRREPHPPPHGAILTLTRPPLTSTSWPDVNNMDDSTHTLKGSPPWHGSLS